MQFSLSFISDSLRGGLKALLRPFNSGPPPRSFFHPTSFVLVSIQTPLSSGCETALNTLALSPLGVVLLQVLDSWSTHYA